MSIVKNSDKIIIAILFLALNMGALYLISTFFNVGYGILFGVFVTFFAALDFSKRIRNAKILRKQRKIIKKQEEERQRLNKARQQEQNERKRNAVQRQNQRNRMREHYNYVNKNKKR